MKGYPTDGAEDLLRANGRDLSVPHRIVAFITWADGAHVFSPLVDITDKLPAQRGMTYRLKMVRRRPKRVCGAHERPGIRMPEGHLLQPRPPSPSVAGKEQCNRFEWPTIFQDSPQSLLPI